MNHVILCIAIVAITALIVSWIAIFIALKSSLFSGPEIRKESVEPWLKIFYSCPVCYYDWDEEGDCACDSECPECGTENIECVGYCNA